MFYPLRNILFFIVCAVHVSAVFGQIGWQNLGPNGGLMDAMAADYKTPGRLIVGTGTGEFYRSNDDGQTWSFLSKIPNVVIKLVIDSSDGNRMYASDGQTIYYSTNGGSSWTAAANDNIENVFDMYVHPLNSSQVYAVSAGGIFRSVNGGQSWSAIYEPVDTAVVSAFAFDPQDPQSNYYVGLQFESGRATIVYTNNGVNFNQVYQLPLNWKATKLYVNAAANSPVMALIGSTDSTKIIRSINAGGSWSIPFATNKPLLSGFANLSQYNWVARKGSIMEFIIGTPFGILKTNNGGSNWIVLNKSVGEAWTTTLTRAPNDTAKFYGRAIGETGVSKITLTTAGVLAFTDINYGLTATQINKIHYVKGEDIVATSSTYELLVSKNGGFDFTNFGIGFGHDVATGFRSDVSGDFYWITNDGYIWQSPNGITSALWDSVNFPVTFDSVFGGQSINYHEELSNEDSSIMVVAVGKSGVPNGTVLYSVDDGRTWVNMNYGGVFNTARPADVNVEYDPLTRDVLIYASTNQQILQTRLKGPKTWIPVYTTTVGSTIDQMSARHYNLIVLTENQSGNKKLEQAFRDFGTGQWSAIDISNTFGSIPQFSPDRLDHVFAGEDGNYVIIDFPDRVQKVYKSGFAGNFQWVEITESPVDLLDFQSVADDFDYEDQSSILYGAANNGIWRLKQTPVISVDSLIQTPSASLNTGDTTEVIVSYHNSGAAYAYIDSFKISGPAANQFSIADSYLAQQGIELGYPLSIKSATPVELRFVPQSVGVQQATLTAYYSGRSSLGNDSSITLTTQLLGNVKASRIGTSLKGDTLDFAGALLGGSKTQTFTLFNSGSDVLYVYDVYVDTGDYFEIANINGTDSVEFEVQPGKILSIAVTFSPDDASNFRDRLIVKSSAFNFMTNTPDSTHVIRLTGTGSEIEIDNLSSLSPVYNRDLSIEVKLAQLSASEVNGFIKYRALGSGASAYKEKSLSPLPGGGNTARFSATIPQEDITEKGLQFYVEVTSGGKTIQFPYSEFQNAETNPYTIDVSIPSPGINSSGSLTLPGGTSAKAYRLVSIPLNLTDKTPTGAFRESRLGELGDKGDWQLYRYNNLTERFVTASDGSFGLIEAGRSYLLITRQPKTLNSGAGKTVTIDDAVTIIQPGWNMIANPYAFNILWTGVAYLNSKINYANIVVLQNGKFRYVDDLENTDLSVFELEPWKGYMYYSEPDSGIFPLVYPPVTLTALTKSSRRIVSKSNLNKGEYFIRLGLKNADDVLYHTAGEIEEASDGFDGFDKRSLPVLDLDDVRLIFSNALHSEFKPISHEGSTWDFEIQGGAEKTSVQLYIADIAGLPAGYEVWMIDRGHNEVHTISDGKIDINVSSKKPAHYRLMAGTQAYLEQQQSTLIPTQYYLGQNYPNPFNPTTSIRYGLPQPSKVRLTVYNILGQEVVTLFNGLQNASSYVIPWNGRNGVGQTVASGLYIYRLETQALNSKTKFTQTRKMLFLK
ncbi:T9SS type A sorting domain-containing protein [bacterium]|nr:T9SS type A sorting domain-containing protein [bacterium]